jgi:uncharacterized protein YqgC (DUF456 family)
MDTFLLISGLLLVIAGVVGSVVPVLPGPSLGWVGVLLLYLTEPVPMDRWKLILGFIIALVVTVLDYIIPAMGTKKYGGTRFGMWGTVIGLIVGLILPVPLGFLLGAFAGAYIGEILHDSKDTKRALRAAYGSFVGFLSSTFLKLVVSIGFVVWFVNIVLTYSSDLLGMG